MKKNIAVSFIGGVALSAVALYFAFKNVPFAELFKYLASINYFWIFPATLITIISFVLRAMRWRIILDSAKKISVMRAFHPMMIGFMINCILPGRLGEIARPVILQKEENIPFATGLATVVAERVFDVCLLILLFMLAAGVLQINPDQSIGSGKYQLNQETLQAIFDGMLTLGTVLIAGIVLFSIGKVRKLIYRTIMFTPELLFFAGQQFKSSLRKKVCEPVINILKNIALGFSLIRYPKKIILCAVFSVLIWGLQAFSYYLFSLGSPGINLTFLEISTTLVIICFFISLPSVPGWWGLWEAGGVFALSLFGVSAREAAGFTLANHALQVFPVIIAGLLSAMILSVNIRQMSYDSKNFQQKQPTVNSEMNENKNASKLDILTFPDDFLSKPTQPLDDIDGKVQEMIDKMAATMYDAPGIGLAAIQVGWNKSLTIYDVSPRDEKRSLHVLINPKIITREEEIVSENEGCLSVPDFRADVKRAACITVEGYNRDGKPVKIDAEGMLAIVLQHEIDHLNGRLFIEHISSLKRQMYKRRIKKKIKMK